MQERTDDQLDDLFRKSAEEVDPPFDTAAWQAMRSRLDAHDRATTPAYERLLRWGLPVLLLLLLIGGWYGYRLKMNGRTTATPAAAAGQAVPTDQSTSARIRPVETRDKPLVPGQSDQPGSLATEPTTSIGKAPLVKPGRVAVLPPATAEPVTTESATTEPAANGRTTAKSLPAKTKSSPKRRSEGVGVGSMPTVRFTPANQSRRTWSNPVSAGVAPASARRPRVFSRQTSRLFESRLSRNRDSFAGEPVRPTNPTNPNPPASEKTKPAGTGAQRPETGFGSSVIGKPVVEGATDTRSFADINKLPIRPGRWTTPRPLVGRAVAAQPDTMTRRPASQPVPGRGLSVRFVVSPDLSTLGLRDFQRPGTNVGLLLEYRLNGRWSVQAGAMQSTKVYKASTTGYEFPAYVSKWTVQPEGVNGQCSLIDIPINLRYDVALRPRRNGQVPSRWFVSGGATTYILRKEDYTYNYADPSSPHIYANMKGYHHDSTTRYNFSQLNLSVGYERALSRRLSWQIEPFMKVPLKGIGYLKMDLLSTGAFFSVRYKL